MNYGKKTSGARPLKVGEMLRHALSEIFLRGDVNHPDLVGASITVSEVRISPDLKNATAYVMPLAGSNKEIIIEALTDSAAEIRYLLAKKVQLRYMPRIHYKLDSSYDEAHHINELLNSPDVQQDLQHSEEKE